MGRIIIVSLAIAAASCRPAPPEPRAAPAARNLIVFTIDTLRADRVGAYGDSAARTPVIDALAANGALFTQAFAVAPITLPSHASILTGRYPPGHGARHNGLSVNPSVPTIAERLRTAGFATGAFVGAFPLDRRFGLDRGFGTYGDRMPRGVPGQPVNERPGRDVVDDAIAWLAAHRTSRFFLWVHVFEPHAPYGNAADGRPASARYEDEVAEADRQLGRVLEAAGDARSSTLVAVTADHGEAFGEHGEIAHSIFVYDTTLRVPLVLAGPGVPHRRVDAPVSHVDLAPTLLPRLGVSGFDADGVDLAPAIDGRALAARELYAESYAPLLDFGWSPLRAIRAEGWKFIDAPRPELFAVVSDPGELEDRSHAEASRAAAMRARLAKYGAYAASHVPVDAESRGRLQALGYVGGTSPGILLRPDPKDRRTLAAQLARVTSGELRGSDLEAALRDILRIDGDNPQAHVRLGFVLRGSGRCPEAERHFRRAIDARMPGADAHLGLAECQASARRFESAAATLRAADRVEPGNPVVSANLGLVLSDAGRVADAIPHLERAVSLDPGFDRARFHLAITLARLGRRADAAREARELLRRLPADAPQRAEVERLVKALE